MNLIKQTRRKFLAASLQLAVGIVLSTPFDSLASQPAYQPISLYHTHTGETLDIKFNPRTCTPERPKKVCRFLRDFRTGDIHPIDMRLLDILSRIHKASGSAGTFEVISGYRSPATNALLRRNSTGVAKKSLHMEGRAIDIRLSDVPTHKLRSLAWALQRGGVGYYAQSDFLHVDTGRVRTW